MNYKISGIVPKQYENEIAGGDVEPLITVKRKSKAFGIAKKESENLKWWEVQIKAYDDEYELQGHWYFKNGKLTDVMSI